MPGEFNSTTTSARGATRGGETSTTAPTSASTTSVSRITSTESTTTRESTTTITTTTTTITTTGETITTTTKITFPTSAISTSTSTEASTSTSTSNIASTSTSNIASTDASTSTSASASTEASTSTSNIASTDASTSTSTSTTTTPALIETTTTQSDGSSTTTTKEANVTITTTGLETTVELSQNTTTTESSTAGITTQTTETFTFSSTDPTRTITYNCENDMYFDAISETFQEPGFWDSFHKYITDNSTIIAEKCTQLAGLAIVNNTIIHNIANLGNLTKCANDLIETPPVRVAMQNAGIAATYTAEQLSSALALYIKECGENDTIPTEDPTNSSAGIGQQIAAIVIPLALVCALAVDGAARGEESVFSKVWSGIMGFVGGFGRRVRVDRETELGDEEAVIGMFVNEAYNPLAPNTYEKPVLTIKNIIKRLQHTEAALKEAAELRSGHNTYDQPRPPAASYTPLRSGHATYQTGASEESEQQTFDRLRESIIRLSNQLAQSSTDADENDYEQPVALYTATAANNVNPDTVRLFQQAESLLGRDGSQLPGAVADDVYEDPNRRDRRNQPTVVNAATQAEPVYGLESGTPLGTNPRGATQPRGAGSAMAASTQNNPAKTDTSRV